MKALSFLLIFISLNVSAKAVTGGNYEILGGCEKQEVLWSKIEDSKHDSLPAFKKFGLFQLILMGMQELNHKGSFHSDFAPQGWKKYIHSKGSVAKVRIIPTNSKYTGVFQGAECGLLRLSLTYKPKGKKPVAPGLALKVLRDKTYSANISALVSLDGQKKDFNFFKYPLSNIVPISNGFGQKLVHKLFRKYSRYPEELLLSDMALIDSKGVKEAKAIAPRQIFFVPNPELSFPSAPHDIREDFATIPEGTLVYRLYAVKAKYSKFDYSEYNFEQIPLLLEESEHIADIVTTSEFVASEFGDDRLFFRHQLK